MSTAVWQYQENVVEEKHFSLMSIKILSLRDVGDFTESAVADEASTRHGQRLYTMHEMYLLMCILLNQATTMHNLNSTLSRSVFSD